MHTLNIFPFFLDYGLLAPFFIRVAAGLIFLDLGVLKLNKERGRWLALYQNFLKGGPGLLTGVALIEAVGGILLLIGLYTQIAAIVLAILSFFNLYFEWRDPAFVRRSFAFHLMLFVMTVSLVFSGAGFLAFDYPL